MPKPCLIFPDCLNIFLWLACSNQILNEVHVLYLVDMFHVYLIYNSFLFFLQFPFFFKKKCHLFVEEIESFVLKNFSHSRFGYRYTQCVI